jgi:hypothetical protein
MTLDKAIEVLENQIVIYGKEYDDEGIEALTIAIYVLKEVCCINGLYEWED